MATHHCLEVFKALWRSFLCNPNMKIIYSTKKGTKPVSSPKFVLTAVSAPSFGFALPVFALLYALFTRFKA